MPRDRHWFLRSGGGQWGHLYVREQRESGSPETLETVPFCGSTPVAPTTNQFYLASPALANGIVYVGDGAGVLWALKASDGTLLWKYVTNSQHTFAPTVSNGVVYVTETYSSPSYTYALDATTGSLLWKYESGNTQGMQPAVSGNRVYAGGDYHLAALDAENGSAIWAVWGRHTCRPVRLQRQSLCSDTLVGHPRPECCNRPSSLEH